MESQAATATVVLCVLLFSLHLADAEIGFGPCSRRRQAMTDFQIEKYTGYWYELARFGAWFELNATCVQTEYSLRPDGALDVFNFMVGQTSLMKSEFRGSAVEAGVPGEGKLAVTFKTMLGYKTGPYWVLGTDYDNYSVVYACLDFIIAHYDYGMILSRQPKMTQMYKNRVIGVLATNQVQPSLFSSTPQNCGILSSFDSK